MAPQRTGVAFSVDADSLMSFARALPRGIDNPRSERLMLTALVDFDLCWAFDLADPWGTSTSSTALTTAELVEADTVEVVHYWPNELSWHTSTPRRRSPTRPVGRP